MTYSDLGIAHAEIQRAVDAAQNVVFAVSLESAVPGEPLRRYQWPEVTSRTREPLRLDMQTVEDYRTGLDTMTCVVSHDRLSSGSAL